MIQLILKIVKHKLLIFMKTKHFLTVLTGIFISSALIFYSCEKKEETGERGPSQPTYTNGEGIVGSKGGTVKMEDPGSPINGAYINIPEEALASDVNIKISTPPDEVKYPVDTTVQMVSFEPHDLKFKKPVEIGIPYFEGTVNDLSIT